MKCKFLYGLLLIGIISISKVSYAQEMGLQEIITGKKDTREEDKNLEFQTYFFEALKQKAINNYSKAIENLENCYQLDATSIAVEFEFSKNYLLLKQYFEAEIFINKALEKEPANEYLLAHKVVIFRKQSNFDKAIEIQKELNKINPKYSDELVLLYLQSQQYEKAETMIVEIESKALSTTKIKGYKRYIENRNNAIKKGLNASQKAVKSSDVTVLKKQFESNKDYKTLQLLLNEELKNGLYDLLYMDSKNGLEFFPSQPFLYQMNGLALNKLAKYNEAIAVLTIGIDFVIDNNEMEVSFYEELSMAYEGINNKSEALKYKQKAEKLRQVN